jgi:hypothetical protein
MYTGDHYFLVSRYACHHLEHTWCFENDLVKCGHLSVCVLIYSFIYF